MGSILGNLRPPALVLLLGASKAVGVMTTAPLHPCCPLVTLETLTIGAFLLLPAANHVPPRGVSASTTASSRDKPSSLFLWPPTAQAFNIFPACSTRLPSAFKAIAFGLHVRGKARRFVEPQLRMTASEWEALDHRHELPLSSWTPLQFYKPKTRAAHPLLYTYPSIHVNSHVPTFHP